jgi:hypothetical protein
MDEASRESVPMKYKYWSVYECNESDNRRIYTFDNEMAAHDLVEFILKNDFMPPNLIVEEHEATA